MPNLLAIPGSLRRRSYNAALARAAAELAPEGCRIEVASLRDVPLYDGDVEAQGLPPGVEALKQRLLAADGLLLFTPEYNHSVPGVLKNAIDWLSRPPKDIPRVFGGRPVGLLGASAGPGGTRQAQAALLPTLRTLGTVPFFGKGVHVGFAAKVFDEDGRLVDDAQREQLAAYLVAFCAFVGKLTG
jgi:NAD(P)H-dependent FMN reductase